MIPVDNVTKTGCWPQVSSNVFFREANSRLGTGDDDESFGYSSSDRALVL
jgi:hypothetical protein